MTKKTANERLDILEKKVFELSAEINSYIEVAKSMNIWKVDNDMKEMGSLVDSLKNAVSELNKNIKDIKDKYTEEFTNNDLKELYAESGLTIEDIKMRFGISAGAASRLINGEIKDLLTRSEFGRFCRYAKAFS